MGTRQVQGSFTHTKHEKGLLQEYSKDFQELAIAIDFFEKNKTNTHKLKGYEQV